MKTKRKKPYKIERVSSEIEKIVQEVITYEIKDPRVCGNATVSDIKLSPDLSYCKIYVEVMCDEKEEVMAGLKNASGFIRHAIIDSLDMRKTPELSFVLDDTADKAKRIDELLMKIKQN